MAFRWFTPHNNIQEKVVGEDTNNWRQKRKPSAKYSTCLSQPNNIPKNPPITQSPNHPITSSLHHQITTSPDNYITQSLHHPITTSLDIILLHLNYFFPTWKFVLSIVRISKLKKCFYSACPSTKDSMGGRDCWDVEVLKREVVN